MFNFKDKKIHMIGIGGIGMSGLASILGNMGCGVSGSDIEENNIMERLRSEGVTISMGHDAANIKNQDLIVYSSSIRMDNPEIISAGKRRIRVIPRIELLKMVMERYKQSVAVTGTHGKTTITAMSSLLLELGGFDPTVLIGGESPHFDSNAKFGKKNTLVTEIDESDGRFVILRPSHIIISNLEREHVEHYKDEGHMIRTFKQFLSRQSRKTVFIYNADDRNLMRLAAVYKGKKVSFGFSEESDLVGKNVKTGNFRSDFDCFQKGVNLGHFTLNVPGLHNVLDALAVISLGKEFGMPVGTIKNALERYKSVKRRFEVIGEVNGAKVVEDYAHHPTEIKATIRAALTLKPKKIITVFQPHRYTRTKSFYREFSDSFGGSDEVILTEVYSASEDKIEGAGTKRIYDIMAKKRSIPVKLLERDKISEYLSKRVKKGYLVLVLGAGNIGKIAHELVYGRTYSGIKGKVLLGEPLYRHTTFRIGGPCEAWIEPESETELKRILKSAKLRKKNVFVIGNGSNILFNDKGLDGIVIHLGGRHFKNIRTAGLEVRAGAGASLGSLINLACEKGLKGIEGLVGIPATLGGAISMNACYSGNISDRLESVRVMDVRTGKISVLKKKNIKFSYRHSGFEGYIILEACFKLEKGDKDALLKRKKELIDIKRKKQPLEAMSAGCVFKNPEGGIAAARYIDMIGLKGRRIGGAEISKKHANFIVNRKKATAKDVLGLMDLAKKRVKSHFNIDLEPEVIIA